MKIRNLSNIDISRTLWRSLADAMGLGGILPLAANDPYGLYESCRVLRVVVNVQRSRRRKEEGKLTVGTYSLGRISLFPCPRCTPGFLTLIFLHELCHAWLAQYHEVMYETYDSCGLCDRFATRGFRIIGGLSRGRVDKCWTYELSAKHALKKMPEFTQHAVRLIKARESALLKKLGSPLELTADQKAALAKVGVSTE